MVSSKPMLALVHGWGMNARAFDPLVECLADDFELRALNLPGHGGREPLPHNSLQSWADDLAQQLPRQGEQPATLLGWSLGGQVALRAALDYPQHISRLIVLAATPKFMASADWEAGMAEADLQAFGAALIADSQATILRFLSLQTRGMADQKMRLLQLRKMLLAAPLVHADALAAGLAMLRDTDLRADLPQLTQPTLVLHGALDTLTPPAAGNWLSANVPATQHIELDRAAHAPHLSHPVEVAAAIRAFVHG